MLGASLVIDRHMSNFVASMAARDSADICALRRAMTCRFLKQASAGVSLGRAVA